MLAPRAEAPRAQPVAAVTTDAQADLVRRYARMLRSASASASASAGMTRRASGRTAGVASSARFTRPAAPGRRTEDA